MIILSFPVKTLYTKVVYTPGAEMGLQLLINIEEYDHTEYYNTDSGIRVNLNL